MISGFIAALGFLTIVPTPRHATPPNLARATTYFPLVGGLIGGAVATAFLLPLDPLARGVLMLIMLTVVTGGLHEDAWVDVADAALAPMERHRRLAILKDPHVGAHGLTATILLLLARFAAFTTVPASAVVAAPVVGRWLMVLSLRTAPPLFTEGLGASLSRGARPWTASVMALAVLGALGTTGSAVPLLLTTVAAAGSVLLWGRFLVSRFGGLNGDGHGSVGILGETVVLSVWMLWEGVWT